MEHSDYPLGKPDLATVNDLAGFFRIDRSVILNLMNVMGVPKRGAGYPWLRVWVALGINLKVEKDPDVLKNPLLELKDVAALLGESPKTTRRRSDGKHRDKSIPAHIDLGPRKRLYFPDEIQSWILDEPSAFERKKQNLTFILPNAEKKKGATKKGNKMPAVTQPSSPTAAALFMSLPKAG